MRSPARSCGVSAVTTASTISAGSARRPAPSQPHASEPDAGPTMRTPRSASVRTFACVATCSHMLTFIAGATTSGARVASSTVVRRSSAIPCAIFAITFAVAGAITTASAVSASRMWPISDSSVRSKVSSATRFPDSVWSVISVTNSRALRVITTWTAAPAWRS